MRIRWKLVTWQDREYAVCCGRRFRCVTNQQYQKSGDMVATWKWVPEIKRYVNYKCMW